MSHAYSERFKAEQAAKLRSVSGQEKDYVANAMSILRAGVDAEIATVRRELTTAGNAAQLATLQAQLVAADTTLTKLRASLTEAAKGIPVDPNAPVVSPPLPPPLPQFPSDPLVVGPTPSDTEAERVKMREDTEARNLANRPPTRRNS